MRWRDCSGSSTQGWQNQHIAYLPQGGRAFSRSMRENVLLGRDVSAESLSWAIRVSGLEAVLSRLPGGIDATPGESGAQISGGEAQRLALARAICLKPAILLLDEATAALDPEGEATVMNALREPLYSPTLVIVSHRLSTIQRADRIVVLAEGRVDAVGRHDELIRTSEAYRRVINQRASQPSPVSASEGRVR